MLNTEICLEGRVARVTACITGKLPKFALLLSAHEVFPFNYNLSAATKTTTTALQHRYRISSCYFQNSAESLLEGFFSEPPSTAKENVKARICCIET